MAHGKTQHQEQPLGVTAHRQHKQEAATRPGLFVCLCVRVHVCLNACVFVQDFLSNAANLDLVAVKYNLTWDISQTYLHPDWIGMKRCYLNI